MSTPTVDPVDYSQRAGLNPRPVGFVDDWSTMHTPDQADAAREAGLLIWADGSDAGQAKIVDSSYPYRLLEWRMHNGFSIDSKFAATRAFVNKSKRIETLLTYCVFNSQWQDTLREIRNFAGTSIEFAIATDMESGSQFAGPGDHSQQANDFVGGLRDLCVSEAQVFGYANSPDWASCWKTLPKNFLRELAAYTSTLYATPGSQWVAQQVYGGLPYPTPAGVPRAIAPWGGWIDINVASMTLQQLQIALGLREDNSLKVDGVDITSDELNALIDKRAETKANEVARDWAAGITLGEHSGEVTHGKHPLVVPEGPKHAIYPRLDAVEAGLDALKNGGKR